MTTGPATVPDVRGPSDAVWDLLVLVALRQGLDEEPDERVEALRRPYFDHGRLVEQAMRHGLLAALAHFLHQHGLRRTLPARLRNPVLSQLLLNRHRARLLTAEALRVSAGFEAAGIRAAWTKGVVVQSTLYEGTGVRVYNDIDVMIAPADRPGALKALTELGYAPSTRFDPVTQELEKISRAAERIYQMSPDHLPHAHRLTEDTCVPVVCVDVANSFTWHGCPWQVPVDKVLARIESTPVGPGATLPALSPADMFLFLCLHLFREGWVERTIRTKDVSLAQFADIARQWRRASTVTRERVAEETREFGLSAPIAWVCAHADQLFATSMVDELGLRATATRAWLASAQGSSGLALCWPGDMERRLRSGEAPVLSPP